MAAKGLAALVPYCELKCSDPQAKTPAWREIALEFPEDPSDRSELQDVR
jgi:hypothetical protein